MNKMNKYLVGEIKVSYNKKHKETHDSLNSSVKCYNYLMNIWNMNTIECFEESYIILLNNYFKPLGWTKISQGGITHTICDPRIIFSIALKCCAVKIVLAHNHPSGNLYPSQEDKLLTKDLISGGKILNIEIADHIVLSDNNFFSFADNKLI